MGAAWAYEALSFGGYWAWDPVENASLVPWLFLVAGMHTNLIAKATHHSIRATYILYLLGFIFVVYSTFLTRSGILGETSAHAFTEMGLEWQLVGFVVIFTLLAGYLLFSNFNKIPTPPKEEKFSSKEFWMYIGSIILFFSGVLIIGATSLPVFNKIYQYLGDPEFAGFAITDPEEHYNRYQLWIGVFIGLVSGLAQMLRYKALNWEQKKHSFYKEIGASIFIAGLLTVIISMNLLINSFQYSFLLFAGVFTIVSNLYYLVKKGITNSSLLASAVSHVGFGIMVIGILFSGLNKDYITNNPFAMKDILRDERLRNTVALFKGEKMFSKNYWMTYVGDTLDGNVRTYDINFKKVDEQEKVIEEFNLNPTITYTNDYTKIAALNPSTNHYYNKDIFLVLSSLPPQLQDVEFAKEMEDTLDYRSFVAPLGNTFKSLKHIGEVNSFTFEPKHKDLNKEEYDLVMGINMTITDTLENIQKNIQPALALKGGVIYQFPEHVDELGIRVKVDENFFSEIFTQEGNMEYDNLTLKDGERINWNGYQLRLNGFDRKPQHKNYEAEESDIAIGANLEYYKNNQLAFVAKPIFVIRKNQRFSVKDYLHEPGIHTRFSNIDPTSEEMEFLIGQDKRENTNVPILMAENVPRGDWIAIEGTVFPFINLVWLGSIMMMLGLTIGLVKRFGRDL